MRWCDFRGCALCNLGTDGPATDLMKVEPHVRTVILRPPLQDRPFTFPGPFARPRRRDRCGADGDPGGAHPAAGAVRRDTHLRPPASDARPHARTAAMREGGGWGRRQPVPIHARIGPSPAVVPRLRTGRTERDRPLVSPAHCHRKAEGRAGFAAGTTHRGAPWRRGPHRPRLESAVEPSRRAARRLERANLFRYVCFPGPLALREHGTCARLAGTACVADETARAELRQDSERPPRQAPGQAPREGCDLRIRRDGDRGAVTHLGRCRPSRNMRGLHHSLPFFG